jgi:hypothetical protein
MLPSKYFEQETTEQVINKIKKATMACDFNALMNYICYIHENMIIIDYRYFKHIASENSYPAIMAHIKNTMDNAMALTGKPYFTACGCIKSLTVKDLDKHLTFFKSLASVLNVEYANTLEKAYIYRAPFIFSQIFSIVSCFVDKLTLQKITIVDKEKA